MLRFLHLPTGYWAVGGVSSLDGAGRQGKGKKKRRWTTGWGYQVRQILGVLVLYPVLQCSGPSQSATVETLKISERWCLTKPNNKVNVLLLDIVFGATAAAAVLGDSGAPASTPSCELLFCRG